MRDEIHGHVHNNDKDEKVKATAEMFQKVKLRLRRGLVDGKLIASDAAPFAIV
jgi:hypothetical protein